MQDFFKAKHRTYIVESSYSIFPLAPLARFFLAVFAVQESFLETAQPTPPPPKINAPSLRMSSSVTNKTGLDTCAHVLMDM